MKPKLVLLDANVIIEAFRIGVWDQLVERVDVAVARSVFEDESVHWFAPTTGERKYIDLARYVQKGRVRVVDGSLLCRADVRQRMPRSIVLHEGELESPAWLTESTETVSFCTADRAAVKALVFLGIAGRAISLETVIEQSAVARSGAARLRVQFREQSLRESYRLAQLEKLKSGR